MAGGRPLKFQSVEEMDKLIDLYFLETPKEEWTVTGLALALDTTRELFLDYKDKPEFSDSISRAYMKVHNSYEIGLRKRGNAGDIFALKNFGWKDERHLKNEDINVKIKNFDNDEAGITGDV